MHPEHFGLTILAIAAAETVLALQQVDSAATRTTARRHLQRLHVAYRDIMGRLDPALSPGDITAHFVDAVARQATRIRGTRQRR